MQLTDRVYMVGSGKSGISITHPMDCSIYLIDTGDGCMMVDSGVGLEPERIDAVIESHGFKMTDIKKLFLTHYHGDHACGAARIQKLSGCEIYAPAKEAEAIREGDEEANSLVLAKGILYPTDFFMPKCPGVIGLEEGDKVTLGDVTLTAYMVPGHSLCDMVLYGDIAGKKCIFTGDAVFACGQILLQSLHDVSIYPYKVAINRLAKLSVDSFFPGHGVFSILDGGDAIKACAKAFNSGMIPRQFYFYAL
ncbi:Hydroxyacylglutathione hydrolase GloC [bioreactor metagenome]|uniref:Hydroxyacylglutathione hydrolase GloC n=1 Tax=bioreactor metagenome TaxID=1076179 RepID=A0A644ZLP7_9ZZZZ